MKEQKKIYVYAHWIEIEKPTLIGILLASTIRGKEIFSFEYNKSWIEQNYIQQLDPDLLSYSGPQYIRDNKSNFGMFLDSSPDRWGRVLMRRREAIIAKKEKRKENTLQESDYLLGVYDGHRMGGLRFKLDENGPFLDANEKYITPPWTSLSELENACLKIEEDNLDDSDYIKWLNLLIVPGSSLGGARPKASVIDKKGNLWIAKFPSLSDNKNIGAWGQVIHDMAIQADINISHSIIKKFASPYHTFLTQRFDRMNTNRIHFASAMTLLGLNDGASGHDGISYLHIAELIQKKGANVEHDLIELWSRIVFSIFVSNTDDHLRNHGFILTNKGWILSPAYDINPNESGHGLSLNISENDNSLEIDLAISVSPLFRLSHAKAKQIIEKTKNAVSKWPLLAKKYGISKSEQGIMGNAFKYN